MARPRKITTAVAEQLLSELMAGRSLRSICEDEGMPDKRTVLHELARNQSLAERYAAARLVQADTIFDEIIDIADDGRNDWVDRKIGGETVRVIDQEAVQRSKLRVDARKWMAGKIAPKKYGEKFIAEVTTDTDTAQMLMAASQRIASDRGETKE